MRKKKKIYFYRIFYHENVNMRKIMFSNVPSGSWEYMETQIQTDVDISGVTGTMQSHSADIFSKNIVESQKVFLSNRMKKVKTVESFLMFELKVWKCHCNFQVSK